MVERKVKYFRKPGKVNTNATLEAVRSYLKTDNRAVAVIVASISGQTALKVSKELKEVAIPIICVSGAPSWKNYPGYKLPLISKTTRDKLEKVKVTIVDSVPSSLADTIEFSFARYGFRSPTWIIVETLLAIGGYGLKTAVECVLMATDGGYVPPFKEVVSVAGTDKGADTAIVARSTFSSSVFSIDSRKRFVVNEILAMPRNKAFYKEIDMGEWKIEETK